MKIKETDSDHMNNIDGRFKLFKLFKNRDKEFSKSDKSCIVHAETRRELVMGNWKKMKGEFHADEPPEPDVSTLETTKETFPPSGMHLSDW